MEQPSEKTAASRRLTEFWVSRFITHTRTEQSLFSAYYPILLSRQLEQMQSDLHQDCSPSASSSISGAGSVMSSSRRSTEPATTLVAISNANLLHVAPSQIIDCSKCSLKEMEIRQLRKRVQALEEQLCRAIGSKSYTCILTEWHIIFS